jgi:methyl-accepting chemotaxis protein
MDLDKAIASHTDWKARLQAAIQDMEQLDARAIGMDDQCELGKWLHGAGKAQFRHLGSFETALLRHAAFHKCAGKVAIAINAGKHAEAKAMLRIGTPYAVASNAVGVAIIALKKEAGS